MRSPLCRSRTVPMRDWNLLVQSICLLLDVRSYRPYEGLKPKPWFVRHFHTVSSRTVPMRDWNPNATITTLKIHSVVPSLWGIETCCIPWLLLLFPEESYRPYEGLKLVGADVTAEEYFIVVPSLWGIETCHRWHGLRRDPSRTVPMRDSFICSLPRGKEHI